MSSGASKTAMNAGLTGTPLADADYEFLCRLDL